MPYRLRPQPNSIRALREAANLTQLDLAREIRVPQSQLSHWERGLNLPSVENALRLARRLGTTVEGLGLEGEHDAPGTAPAPLVASG